MRRALARQRGAALLLAMLTVALVASVSAAAYWQQWRSLQLEQTARQRVQSIWLLTGALDWARLILREDARASSNVDHLAEPWAVPLQETRLSSFLAGREASVDDIAADAITNGASASGGTWTVTANDPSTLIAALYDAATDILNATNFLPDHLFVSPDVWQKLGSQLDADKRPIFPYAGAAGLMGVNGLGTANITVANTFNPFGLNLVADRNFAAGTLYVARGAAIEFYEQVRGLMSVEVPGTLGRTFSYYGYVATFIADSDQVKYIVVS